MSSTLAPIGDYFAWAGPAVCDENGNAYFLVVPPITPGHKPKEPRAVLRISADGKKRFSFIPAPVSEFASAHELQTLSFALDPDGGLFMLVWHEMGGQSGQYIVSFDKNGEYRSHFEVDSREILVQQLEVFGSGQFLAARASAGPASPGSRSFPRNGGELKDVVGWSRPAQALGGTVACESRHRPGSARSRGAAMAGSTLPSSMPGRVRMSSTPFDPRVKAEEVFTLRPMPKAAQLLGWKAAGDRFAAAYFRPTPTRRFTQRRQGKLLDCRL